MLDLLKQVARNVYRFMGPLHGRSVAFTQGQRYVLLSRLEKQPKTTSELVQDTHHPEQPPVCEATNTEKRGNASSDKLSPSNISSEYKHIGKTHRCEVHFTLSKEHLLSYEFQWNGFRGDRFTLSVDDSQIINTKWQFLGISHLRKSFEVENIEGLFSYTRIENHFSVTITVGNAIVFKKEDAWNS